jgi:hypothetical protein
LKTYREYLHGENFQSLGYGPVPFFTVFTKLSHFITARAKQPAQNATTTTFKIHFNITLPLTLKSRKQSLPIGFSDQNFAQFLINPTWAVRLIRLISLDLITAVGDSRSYVAPHYEMLQSTATSPLLVSNVLVGIMFTRFAGRWQKRLKVKGRFIGPSSVLQPYRPIVLLAPVSSLIHLQRRHVPHRHERPQTAKEGTIQGILLAHS